MNFLGGYKYVIDFLVVVALVAAVALGVHKYNTYQQDIGEARKQAQWDADTLRRDAAELQLRTQFQKEKDDAIAQSVQTAQANRAAADAALQSGRVLDNTLKSLLAASASGDLAANREYTATLATVFADCKDKYTEMGRAADGHAADSLMLQNAWPTPK